MTHLERVSSILGAILVGMAAWMIISDRRSAFRAHPPVDKLAADLQQAWADRHTP